MSKHDLGDMDVLQRVKYPKYTPDQFEFFLENCRQHQINPWSNLALLIEDAATQEINFVVKLVGMRAIAARGGVKWMNKGPFFTGEDLKWEKVWRVRNARPFAAMFGIVRDGEVKANWRVAQWDECAKYTMGDRGEKLLSAYWDHMPSIMLGKVAEAFALRQAFPERLGGLYTTDEIVVGVSAKRSSDAMIMPVVDEETPYSMEQLERRMIRELDMGIAEIRTFVASLRAKHANLSETDSRRFYAVVIAEAEKVFAGEPAVV